MDFFIVIINYQGMINKLCFLHLHPFTVNITPLPFFSRLELCWMALDFRDTIHVGPSNI